MSLADELEQVTDQIEEIKAELDPLEEREKEIRAELCESLIKKGLQYVRTTSGMGYGITKGRVTYGIKKGIGLRAKAVEWAVQNYPSILTISAADLGTVVGPMMPAQVPDFVERRESPPHLSVRTNEQ